MRVRVPVMTLPDGRTEIGRESYRGYLLVVRTLRSLHDTHDIYEVLVCQGESILGMGHGLSREAAVANAKRQADKRLASAALPN